jgi:hypothetical protein
MPAMWFAPSSMSRGEESQLRNLARLAAVESIGCDKSEKLFAFIATISFGWLDSARRMLAVVGDRRLL